MGKETDSVDFEPERLAFNRNGIEDWQKGKTLI